MFKGKLRKILAIPLVLMLGVTLIATAACTPEEIELLKGVLQNVDSAKGTVTIVTDDGKTVTVKINAETEVTSEGDNITAVKLEPGAPVEIRVKKDERIAKRIETKKDASRAEWGIVEIRVTDPPPAAVKSAVVYFNSIEVHMASDGERESDNTTTSGNVTSGNMTASDNNGWITVIGTPGSFDLMSVIGVEKILGSANLSAGKYTQIRMSVTNVTGVTTDNVTYTAEVPSDKLKIIGNFSVGSGNTTVLTLDFDGEHSLIRTGEGKFLFKPVVKLLVNNEGKGNVGDRGESENKGKSESNDDKDNPGKGNK